MVHTKVDITDNYYRYRQHDPNLFIKDSFRTIRATHGVKFIIGRKKGEKKTSVQSVLFDKKVFSQQEAENWLKRHEDKFQEAINLEKAKEELFIQKRTLLDDVIQALLEDINKELEKRKQGEQK